jgi:hypothetical protein
VREKLRLCALDELEVVVGMPQAGLRQIPGGVEQFAGVLAHGLQHQQTSRPAHQQVFLD